MSGNPEPSGVRWNPVSQQDVKSQTAPPRLHFRVPPEPSHLLRARERIRDYLRQYCADAPGRQRRRALRRGGRHQRHPP